MFSPNLDIMKEIMINTVTTIRIEIKVEEIMDIKEEKTINTCLEIMIMSNEEMITNSVGIIMAIKVRNTTM